MVKYFVLLLTISSLSAAEAELSIFGEMKDGKDNFNTFILNEASKVQTPDTIHHMWIDTKNLDATTTEFQEAIQKEDLPEVDFEAKNFCQLRVLAPAILAHLKNNTVPQAPKLSVLRAYHRLSLCSLLFGTIFGIGASFKYSNSSLETLLGSFTSVALGFEGVKFCNNYYKDRINQLPEQMKIYNANVHEHTTLQNIFTYKKTEKQEATPEERTLYSNARLPLDLFSNYFVKKYTFTENAYFLALHREDLYARILKCTGKIFKDPTVLVQ